MADKASVRVAVRVRPFNTREIEEKSRVIIRMDGNTTYIENPDDGTEKDFAFDFSYWSHDGFQQNPVTKESEPTPGSKYASQQMVYEDLGQDCLNSAMDGYNSTLFAYGQTGSGKSYSVVGYGPDRGIIPRVCEEMFRRYTAKKEEKGDVTYQISVTMLEIYNEQLRNLLEPKKNPPGGLKLASNPASGVYVKGLDPISVGTLEELMNWKDIGENSRTVAGTKMNKTSSRAHTVFTINFTTIRKEGGKTLEMMAKLNLVDLAGSERANSTGATGQQLKEGCAINTSLSALGNVISALADKADGKKNVFVPYRNSMLTRLLQDALGGNSRTIMVAALSPANINYEETLSTLRYASRAKQIKNVVQKVENPTDKALRLLREENEQLKKMLSQQGLGATGMLGGGGGDAEMKARVAKYEEQLQENERLMNEMKKSWEQKLDEAKKAASSALASIKAESAAAATRPHLTNLNADPQLSEVVKYALKDGVNRIGRKDASEPQDIVLGGATIGKEHCLIIVQADTNAVILEPIPKAMTYINGTLLEKTTTLNQGDRVVFGNHCYFRFDHPGLPALDSSISSASKFQGEEAWHYAHEELTKKQQSASTDDLRVKEMSEVLEKERAAMRAALDDQKRQFLLSKQKSGQLTEEERAQLREYEMLYEAKTREMETKLQEKRALLEKEFQEQAGSRRETKAIEQKLQALMPLINEANSMSEEMGRNIKFEPRLVPKTGACSALEEVKNLKTIELVVRVKDVSDDHSWDWDTEKFETRLYGMREQYQDFQEGVKRTIAKAQDPFWDPPDSALIGRAYFPLKFLAHLADTDEDQEYQLHQETGLIAGAGVQMRMIPEPYPGEPDWDEFLTNPQDGQGKNVVYRIQINAATNLPSSSAYNVFAKCKFHDRVIQTKSTAGLNINPRWAFEDTIAVQNLTAEFIEYLVKDMMIVEIRGYTKAHYLELKELEAATSGSAAGYDDEDQHSLGMTQTQRQLPSVAATSMMCSECQEQPSAFQCTDCDGAPQLCASCFAVLHKSAKKAAHNRIAIGAAAPPTTTASGHLCSECIEQPPTVHCVECSRAFCDSCVAVLHKSAKNRTHTRQPLAATAAAATAPVAPAPVGAGTACSYCREQSASLRCQSCEEQPVYCGDCFAALHKSAKKAAHVKVSL